MKKFVFFGTSNFAVELLDGLKQSGFIPEAIITTPDMPAGRKLILTPPPVKIWSEQNNIKCLQPTKLKDGDFIKTLQNFQAEYFLVASYGKIIPKEILDLAPGKVLNIHPSLLPLYRGPSPIQYQIMNGEPKIGTTLMIIDEEIDHGPIIAKKEISSEIVEDYFATEKKLATASAELFSQVINDWLEGKVIAKEQDHSKATFTKMIEKSDGLLDLDTNPLSNYRKYLALANWPGTYFFKNDKRVIIKKASWKNGNFNIERVLPEGKKEMPYNDFMRGLK